MGNEQTHPLHETDKNIIDSLITKKTPEELENEKTMIAKKIK